MEQNNNQGALQKKMNSGFNATSTTSDVIKGIDLTGKVAIVTDGNTGIGLTTPYDGTKAFTRSNQSIIFDSSGCIKAIGKNQK